MDMNINKETIDKNWNDKIWWRNLSASQGLSKQFVSKYADKLDLNFVLASNYHLRNWLLEEYTNSLDFSKVLFYTHHNPLSIEQIEKYLDKFPIMRLALLYPLPQYFIIKYIDLFEPYISLILLNSDIYLTTNFIIKYSQR